MILEILMIMVAVIFHYFVVHSQNLRPASLVVFIANPADLGPCTATISVEPVAADLYNTITGARQ